MIRWLPLVAWGLVVLVLTGIGLGSIPPIEGAADPDVSEGLGSGPLEGLGRAVAGASYRTGLTPAAAVHGPGKVLIVAAPERALFSGEEAAIDAWMRDGGSLLLFAATPIWNPFLSDYGIAVQGSLLLPTANGSAPRQLVVELPDDLGGRRLILVNSTAVDETGSAGVRLHRPDADTVLDANRNGTIDAGDLSGAFAAVADVKVGNGRIVVVSSVEAALGPGLDRNLEAIAELVGALGPEGAIILDGGAHPRGWADSIRGPAQVLMAQLHWRWLGALLVGAGVVGIVALTPRRPGGLYAHESELDVPLAPGGDRVG